MSCYSICVHGGGGGGGGLAAAQATAPNVLAALICLLKNVYPVHGCAARGKVISRGWCIYKSTLFLESIFYLSKYSLSDR